jgi:hypothetical protein
MASDEGSGGLPEPEVTSGNFLNYFVLSPEVPGVFP